MCKNIAANPPHYPAHNIAQTASFMAQFHQAVKQKLLIDILSFADQKLSSAPVTSIVNLM